MKRPYLLVLYALLLLLSVVGARADLDPALREQGVLYFEDNLPAKVIATVQKTTTLYLHRDFQTPLAAIYNGQKVEIIGMAPEGYLLATIYRIEELFPHFTGRHGPYPMFILRKNNPGRE